MTVKIYKNSVPGVKNFLVSNSTNTQVCWTEIEACMAQFFPTETPFVANPPKLCPMQQATPAMSQTMNGGGVVNLTDAQFAAIIAAYQAANP